MAVGIIVLGMGLLLGMGALALVAWLLIALSRSSKAGAWVAALLTTGMIGLIGFGVLASLFLFTKRPTESRRMMRLEADYAETTSAAGDQISELRVEPVAPRIEVVAGGDSNAADEADDDGLLLGFVGGTFAGAVSPVAAAPIEQEQPVPAKASVAAQHADKPRPRWMDEPPGLHAGAYRQIIHAGPHPRRLEAEQESEEAIRRAVAEYIDTAVQSGASERVNLSWDYIQNKIVRDQYVTVQPRSFSPLTDDVYLVDLYTLLEFGPEVRDEVKSQHRQAVVNRRLAAVGLSLGGVLVLLGATFGVLRRPAKSR